MLNVKFTTTNLLGEVHKLSEWIKEYKEYLVVVSMTTESWSIHSALTCETTFGTKQRKLIFVTIKLALVQSLVHLNNVPVSDREPSLFEPYLLVHQCRNTKLWHCSASSMQVQSSRHIWTTNEMSDWLSHSHVDSIVMVSGPSRVQWELLDDTHHDNELDVYFFDTINIGLLVYHKFISSILCSGIA